MCQRRTRWHPRRIRSRGCIGFWGRARWGRARFRRRFDMPKLTRAEIVWADLRRFVGDDIRGFLSDLLSAIQVRIDALRDRADLVQAALAGKAPLQHTHARAEVTGLLASLTNLD